MSEGYLTSSAHHHVYIPGTAVVLLLLVAVFTSVKCTKTEPLLWRCFCFHDIIYTSIYSLMLTRLNTHSSINSTAVDIVCNGYRMLRYASYMPDAIIRRNPRSHTELRTAVPVFTLLRGMTWV